MSTGFCRQEYWSYLPFPPPRDLPDPGIKPVCFLCLLCWQVRVLQHQLYLRSLKQERGDQDKPHYSFQEKMGHLFIIKQHLLDSELISVIYGSNPFHYYNKQVQFSSVAQLCTTLYDPMECSTPGFPSITNSCSLLKLTSSELVMPSSHLILCGPLLLLPSIPPSIRVFSNESVLHVRWPKYWSFSFSISPSNEYLGLISFRID